MNENEKDNKINKSEINFARNLFKIKIGEKDKANIQKSMEQKIRALNLRVMKQELEIKDLKEENKQLKKMLELKINKRRFK